jgi:NADPH2:quinone reductase
MKEALISTGPKVEIVDTPIPKAGRDQVVIKVVYSGSNPKDWKIPGMLTSPALQHGELVD